MPTTLPPFAFHFLSSLILGEARSVLGRLGVEVVPTVAILRKGLPQLRSAIERDPRISIATVYRTVKLFEEASILERHDFGDGRARYEERPEEHHDHLIDVKTGEVVEFSNEEIERLQTEVARALGYRLVDHRLELFGVRIQAGEDDGGSNGSA